MILGWDESVINKPDKPVKEETEKQEEKVTEEKKVASKKKK